MATKKKDFTDSTNAIEKFFTPKEAENAEETAENKDTNITDKTGVDNITDSTNNNNITKDTQQINIMEQTNDNKVNNKTKQAKTTKHTNVSKHYEERGKREERYGLLLDKQLKEDIQLLSKATTSSKSVNDFIVTVLLEYVEREENQKKLKQYKKLLQG